MAIRPLFPLTKQFQARNGQNNVSGTLEVFYAYTDDRAPTYSDYNGTRNPDLVPIDNNGRAVVLCDDERVYRLVVRDRSGGILWTQEPTVCEGEGSGGSTSIVSEDGSIVVQRTGSVYDLSVNHTDDSRFLDWIRCTGGESVSGYLRPVKAAGTMSVGSLGLSLSPDVLYHVTATVRAVKGSVAPVYGEVSVTLALHDGETATAVRTFSEIADCSMGLSQDYIVDADVHTPGNATQLVFSVTGDDASLSFLLLSVDAHRVYSGVPSIPDEVAQKTWVDANFQKKLVAGANITIDPVTNTISADALTQVQADWAQSDPADMSYIRNKPTLATVATSGSYDDLSDKPAIPAAQVNSDWSASTGVAQILNKPDLSVYATTQAVDTALATKQDTISDLASIRAGAALGDTAVQPGDLAAVATSGSYNDLSDKPDIPSQQVQSDWTESDSADPAYIKHKPSLAAVATSGDYADLSNKPSIPAAQVQSDWTEQDSNAVDYIKHKPDLATVATSGSYNDLTNKPDIPAAQVNSDWSAVSGVSQILNKPDLATVATSGSYDDLTDKPSIPVIPTMKSLVAGTNVTLTEGSTTVTVSAASQVQADWTESNTSDPAYIANKPVLASVATSGSYSDLSNTPSLATVATSGSYSDLSGTPDLSLKEDVANKAQSVDGTSTTDYPSSAAVSDFVNSSVATATARFLGNFTLTDLGLTYPATDSQIGSALDAYTWPVGTTPTNNDYVYVEIQDPQTTGIDDRVERFKYDGTNWLYEYTLNNSSFTAAEKASIDSGITAMKVSNYDAHVANSAIHVTSEDKTAWNGKQDAISDLSTIRSGAQAGATAVQPSDLATVATSGSYDDLLDKPSIPAAQVNSDWNASSGAAQILNKPANLVQDASYVHTDENFTSAEKTKLSGIEAGAQVNVQADWTEADTSSDAYIQNKPSLAAVATSGDYADLSNTPTIPAAQVNADWNSSSGVSEILNKPTLATVATTGAYSDLSGTPTINNVPAVTSVDAGKVLTASYSGGVGSYSWATGGGGGGTVDQTYDPTSTNAQSGTAVAQAVSGKQDTLTAGDGIDITSNVIKWLNTAGVTDIQYVQSLPDNPDAHTLYLIPET